MPLYRGNFGALIQARMNSARLPGKVLKELAGRAILAHVHAAAAEALPQEAILVATSLDPSDDPIAAYCELHGIQVFRGSLENVGLRLQEALALLEVGAFFRICADSPFYDPALMNEAIAKYAVGNYDLVSNVFPRSFPKGRSVELARCSTFLAYDFRSASQEEKEHVFAGYYREAGKFRITNFSSPSDLSGLNLCVDTPEDWNRAVRLAGDGRRALHTMSASELASAFPGTGK